MKEYVMRARGTVAVALLAWCAGAGATALNEPDAAYSIHVTDDLAARGEIDPPSSMLNDKVWLFSGAKDETVYPVVMGKLEEYYRHYVNPANLFYRHYVNPANLFYQKTIPAAHAMITDDYGHPCV